VARTEAKLTRIKQVPSSDVLLDDLQNNFLNKCARRGQSDVNFAGILGSLPGFGKATTFASLQDARKCESRMQ
jgi:hypothetical protein